MSGTDIQRVYDRIGGIESKVDDLAGRVSHVEDSIGRQLPGHTDAQIIQIIDQRLEAVLPGLVGRAVSDELRHPLTLVEEAIRSSHSNHKAIEALQTDMTEVKERTAPIVEIVDGLQFIRRFLIAIGSLAGAASLILAAWNGLVS